MSSHKMGARSGAVGNTRLLAQYGGGSKGPRQGYATGGAVNPSLDEGLAAAGDSGSGMKPMKGDKADKKSAKTNINIIVNGPDKTAPVPVAGPPAPMPMPPPPPMPPAPPMGASGMGPPMGGPPMGPGGPGLPMRAKGGRVNPFEDISPKDKAAKPSVMGTSPGKAKTPVGKHEAVMHPGKPRTARSVGGPANPPTEKGMLAEKGFQGGGGGAIGRLEKIKKFGK